MEFDAALRKRVPEVMRLGDTLIELGFNESKADYLGIKSWLRPLGTSLTAGRAGAILPCIGERER